MWREPEGGSSGRTAFGPRGGSTSPGGGSAIVLTLGRLDKCAGVLEKCGPEVCADSVHPEEPDRKDCGVAAEQAHRERVV